MPKHKLGWLKILFFIFILLALINNFTIAFFDVNILLSIAFKNIIMHKILAVMVGLIGLSGLITIMVMIWKRL